MVELFFFLIGWREIAKPYKDVGNIACYCGNCHNQSVYAIRSWGWVTLFFVPIIPYKASGKLRCSICGCSGKLDKLVVDRLRLNQPVALG